jgi:hypothetical protein
MPASQPLPSTSSDPIQVLETRLAGTLRPVTPSNDFVRRLKGDIRLPAPGALHAHAQDWRALLVALFSVLAGFAVIVMLARILFHISGRQREE